MRHMFWIGAAAVVLALPGGVACGADAPTSPPDPAAAMATNLAAELFESLPSKQDFDAAAAHASLTQQQQSELEPRITGFHNTWKKWVAKVALDLRPAVEIMLTIPQEDDDEDHGESYEQIGLILQEVATRNHNRLDTALNQCESAASEVLGPVQHARWINHLRSSKRLAKNDSMEFSKHEDFDSRKAGDLQCIPDLQSIADWFFDMGRPGGMWSLEHDAEVGPELRAHIARVTSHVNDLFAVDAQRALLEGIQIQMAQIQGRAADAQRLIRKTANRQAKMIEATIEGMEGAAAILQEAGLEGQAADWRHAIRSRMFSTAWGPTRVDALYEAIASDSGTAPLRDSLDELYADFLLEREPLLTLVEQQLVKAVKTAQTPLFVLSLQRRNRQCEATKDSDRRYRALINTTLEDMVRLLDEDQRQAHEPLISNLINGQSGPVALYAW